MKTKKCKHCKQAFVPSRPMQSACGPMCAVALVATQKAKAAMAAAKESRKQDRARRERLKTRPDYLKEAQHAFNAFIRARDAGKPCICCGNPLGADAVGGGFDCGHYRSVGSAPHLRFDERNAHGQRKQCNRYGAGRAVDYRLGLIARLGVEAVESLESNNGSPKWSVDELKAIRDEYRAKLKAMRGTR